MLMISACCTACTRKAWHTAGDAVFTLWLDEFRAAIDGFMDSLWLGSENENVPGFVSIAHRRGMEARGILAARSYPPCIRGRRSARRVALLRISPLGTWIRRRPATRNRESTSRTSADFISYNSSLLPVTIASRRSWVLMKTAWAMQAEAPELFDLSGETASTLDLYGIGKAPTDLYGRQCLLARRLCEAGVRYIQVTYGDNTANPAWDQHSNLPKHEQHARSVDRPIAGLLTDLKRRGLLDDTIVWWGSGLANTLRAAERNRTRSQSGRLYRLAGGRWISAWSLVRPDRLIGSPGG